MRSAQTSRNDPQAPPDWRVAEVISDDGMSVPVRIYGHPPAASMALVVHFHGGNLLDGSLDDGLTMAHLLQSAGAVVVSTAYPQACHQPYPAALDAGRAVLAWASRQRATLAGKGARLYVAGEEGGANLAAALAMQVRDLRCTCLSGQILMSPMLDPRMGTASMRAGMAGRTCCQWAQGWRAYLDCGQAADHPYALPARAIRLAGLPPSLIVTAEDDLMRDEAVAFADRLVQAGTPTRCERLQTATGWPLSLRQPESVAAPWSATVGALMRTFFDPNTQMVANPEATTPQRASNPPGE